MSLEPHGLIIISQISPVIVSTNYLTIKCIEREKDQGSTFQFNCICSKSLTRGSDPGGGCREKLRENQEAAGGDSCCQKIKFNLTYIKFLFNVREKFPKCCNNRISPY